ncbi:MAG TPA: universal stress protein [Phycisphaerae bacterium]|nr:universal stress protein [Phycisphaerae bacterium]HNU46415.1 universal stress protein [Phycisphaerae bacterium]
MEQFKRLGVYLDEWPDDKDVLAFTARIAELGDPESVHVVYFTRRAEDDPRGPFDHEGTLRRHLSPGLMQRVTMQVERQGAVDTMLRAARRLDLDLVLAGRVLPASQLAVGHGFNRLARKAPCDVLLIPEGAAVHLSRVLVPVDFSDHSRMALRAAALFARASGEPRPQLYVQTVFAVGYGYSKAGCTLEEAVRGLEQIHQQRLEEFVQGVDLSGLSCELHCSASDEPEAAIVQFAQARKADLICVGSRGMTPTASVLLGGTVDRLVTRASLPLLIVKRKGETLGLLDALLGK